jgi:formyltetrahydrofolate deformylase
VVDSNKLSKVQRTVIKVDCRDAPGVIFKITGAIFAQNLNIINNTEFVDHASKRFFMRAVFEGQPDMDRLRGDLNAALPLGANIYISEKVNKPVVVLATKEHHCLSDLLIRNFYGDLNMNILAVISNYEELGTLVRKFDLPFHHLSHSSMSREDHEQLLLDTINMYSPEYLILAKYMRILSPSFVANFPHRIVNIHHSFLPAFVGANPYRQAYDRGVKIIGATAHFVNNDLDEGPIIAQDVIHVDHRLDAPRMARAGKEVEKKVLATAMRLLLEDRIFVFENKTVIFD